MGEIARCAKAAAELGPTAVFFFLSLGNRVRRDTTIRIAHVYYEYTNTTNSPNSSYNGTCVLLLHELLIILLGDRRPY